MTGTAQKVLERLTLVSVPPGVQPQIGTDWSLTGQIYWYTIRSTNPSYDLMDQRSIEDWTLLQGIQVGSQMSST